MNVLVLGSGGRAYAIAQAVASSPLLGRLYITPGNGGTGVFGEHLDIAVTDQERIIASVLDHHIDLVIIGPEQPLAEGLVDALEQAAPDVAVFGPKRTGARLESSKAFAKGFMQRHDIPTAAYEVISSDDIAHGHEVIERMGAPIVLKADGLAAGKGVLICQTTEQAHQAFDTMVDGQFGAASQTVVAESFLVGIEYSAFVLTDGKDYRVLPYAKDYKRVGDGDHGLNTGGMGAVSPVAFIDDELHRKTITRIIEPTIAGLQKDDIPYRGILFIGLMAVDGEPYVIEYNVRLGDPETQVVLPRITSDWLEMCDLTARGRTNEVHLHIDDMHHVGVVMASGGYPLSYEKGKVIHGLEALSTEDHIAVYHAGTARQGDALKTAGGRVLLVLGMGDTLESAQQKAYQGVSHISFEKQYNRTDIGSDLLRWQDHRTHHP